LYINLIGQRNIFGGGIHYGNFCDALKKLNLFGGFIREIGTSLSELSSLSESARLADIHIFFYPPSEQVSLKGFVVKWGIFETTKLPAQYVEWLSDCHLIWVPSRWAKNVLVEHGIPDDVIDVVPEGVDPNIFHPHLREMMVKDNVFRFYCCGKKEDRKGFPELLEAFHDTFAHDKTVQLVFKADNFWSDSVRKTDKSNELRAEIKELDLNNVTIISGEKATTELAYINSFCDAFVFPSRAEGWGLPLIEAIACGLPVAANFYGGQSEYLESVIEYITCLDFNKKRIDSVEFIDMWGEGGEWAVATKASISESMLHMKENYELAHARAAVASEVIRERFSWDKAAEKAILSLKNRDRFKLSLSLNI